MISCIIIIKFRIYKLSSSVVIEHVHRSIFPIKKNRPILFNKNREYFNPPHFKNFSFIEKNYVVDFEQNSDRDRQILLHVQASAARAEYRFDRARKCG